jgi:hypothetical protein
MKLRSYLKILTNSWIRGKVTKDGYILKQYTRACARFVSQNVEDIVSRRRYISEKSRRADIYSSYVDEEGELHEFFVTCPVWHTNQKYVHDSYTSTIYIAGQLRIHDFGNVFCCSCWPSNSRRNILRRILLTVLWFFVSHVFERLFPKWKSVMTNPWHEWVTLEAWKGSRELRDKNIAAVVRCCHLWTSSIKLFQCSNYCWK